MKTTRVNIRGRPQANQWKASFTLTFMLYERNDIKCLMIFHYVNAANETKEKLTYAGGLRATPGAIVLTISPGGSHQDEGRVAGEGDRGEIGESSVLPPPLRWHPWVSAEHSCKDEGGKREMTH